MVRAMLVLVVSAAMMAASGCCNPYIYRGGCGLPGPCGSCGPCEPSCGPCEPCGPEVAPCGPAAPCGVCVNDPCCGDCGPPCHGCYPLLGFWRWLTCGSGCGDVYVNEWCSDPPDCCDPCDPCGNFVGPQCCPPRHSRFLQCLFGQPCCEPFLPTIGFFHGCCPPACGDTMACGGGCGDCGGCGGCGGGYDAYGGAPLMSEGPGRVIEPAPRIVPGSPADSGSQQLVPELAPTGRTTTTAYQMGRRRGSYYPYGRIRNR